MSESRDADAWEVAEVVEYLARWVARRDDHSVDIAEATLAWDGAAWGGLADLARVVMHDVWRSAVCDLGGRPSCDVRDALEWELVGGHASAGTHAQRMSMLRISLSTMGAAAHDAARRALLDLREGACHE